MQKSLILLYYCLCFVNAYTYGQTIKYTYDSQNRIKSVLFPNGNTEFYWYDKVGNRENMSVFLGTPTAINEVGLEGEFNVFPNPTDGLFNLTGKTTNEQDFVITIIDNTGKEIKAYSINSTLNFNQEIDIKNIASGTYHLTLKSNKGLRTWTIVKI